MHTYTDALSDLRCLKAPWQTQNLHPSRQLVEGSQLDRSKVILLSLTQNL